MSSLQNKERGQSEEVEAHEKIRRATQRRKTAITTSIIDTYDNMVFERESLINIWTEYMEEIYMLMIE